MISQRDPNELDSIPPDSNNCTIVHTAMCWNVASGLVRKL